MVPGHISRSKIMDQVAGMGRGIGTVCLGLEFVAKDPTPARFSQFSRARI